jgi:hypothetical protein
MIPAFLRAGMDDETRKRATAPAAPTKVPSSLSSLVDMGEGVPGETRSASVELTNRTDEPIRLIGGTSDCSCTVLADLPVTIPPGESRSITVAMRLPNATGAYNRKAGLRLDDIGFREVRFRLVGRINKGSN